LRETLDGYAELMQLGRFNVHVESFVPGTVEDLKALLFDHVDMHDIEGALLIGELPAAWYEQVAFSYHEEFPTDIYLQDRDAVWTDEDGDGIFDHHSDLNLDIYTARLNGTSTQLQDYFARARYYRRVGPLVDVSAFIFIDDDWSSANTSDEFHLGELYSNVNVLQDEADSTFANYLARLTGSGAEFVYQWIHSAPLFLSIHDQDEQGKLFYSKVLSRDIAKHDLKASFFNLFDCSAARFTGENLAEEYVVATDYGLAAIGSTKTGAVNDPHFFHENLVLGRRWGEAYQMWFNEVGKRNDAWHLGIVLMGDPLLRLTGDLFPSGWTDVGGWDPPGAFEELMETIAQESELSTFEEYRDSHPEFFDE
jgi:hypothetical protein